MSTTNDSMLSVRIPAELHDRSRQAAADRNLALGTFVASALEDFLGRLIPADELRLTRDDR